MDIKIEKKKGIKMKQVLYAVALILLVVFCWKLIESYSVRSLTVEKTGLNISEVREGKFDDYMIINGAVAPISTIYMDAYEGGRVNEKLIEEGSMVKKGDVILVLENRGLYEQILSSENNLALKQNDLRSTKLAFDARQNQGKKEFVQATFELKRLKRNFEQNQDLYDEGLISKEVYLTSKEDYELSVKQNEIIQLQTKNDDDLRNNSLRELDSDLERMRRTLSMVYERIDHLKVKAPADGQLGFLDAEIGQRINQGDRIGQLNVLTNYKVEAFIDEHYIDRVRRGLSATLERNEQTYQLYIRKIYPEVRDGKFKVDFIFDGQTPENSRAGQSHKIKLQLGASEDAILLSKGGFFQSTGGRWVFVVDENEKQASQRFISIGKQNSKYYEVIEGLKPNEKVITSSYENFGDAQKIEIED